MTSALLAAAVAAAVVYPSSATVPQQLLRITVQFAVPQDPAIAERVDLRGPAGALPIAFADPPLWSADMRTLTLLLDPSRQKRGIADHERYGFVLPLGRVQLAVDGRSVKTWRVVPGGCAELDPSHWIVRPVRAGTTEPLTVTFPAPIDVLSRDRLAVAAAHRTPVPGRAALAPGERRWSFAPAAPWHAPVSLAIHPRLEDPCGDEIGEPFEHRAGAGLDGRRATTFRPIAVTAR